MICSQLPVAKGYDHLKEPTLANALLDPIIVDKAYQGGFAEKATELELAFEVPERPEGMKGVALEAKRRVVERTISGQYFLGD